MAFPYNPYNKTRFYWEQLSKLAGETIHGKAIQEKLYRQNWHVNLAILESRLSLFLYFSNSLSLSFSLSPSLHSSPLIFWLPVIILERSLLWGWAACSIPVRSIHACLPASLPEACLFAVGREESSYAALQCLLTACLAWLAVGPKGDLVKAVVVVYIAIALDGAAWW